MPPLACNAITYLQDLTEEYGPLRVIPGSHRRDIGIA
ncbi:MAG: phytanoyl-CoA dioxygenase family protein, partial [Burkholderiaceae bacterium]